MIGDVLHFQSMVMLGGVVKMGLPLMSLLSNVSSTSANLLISSGITSLANYLLNSCSAMSVNWLSPMLKFLAGCAL